MKLSGPTCLLQCERGGVYALLSKPRDVGVKTNVRIPGSVSDSIVGHVVIRVVSYQVTLRHHPDETLFVPSNNLRVVVVKIVGIDEECGSDTSLQRERSISITHRVSIILFTSLRASRT